MKNSLLAALSILLAVSCVSEVTDNYTNYIPRSVLLTANVDDSYSTKAGISEYGSFFWTENDQVAVYSNYNRFSIFRLKQGAGLSTAVFSGSMEDAEYPDRLAVFPSSIASSYDNDILKVVLPSSYEYRDDYALGTPPMLATISESDEIVFNHLCGMIRFTLDQVPEMATEIRLTSPDNQLSGEFDVSVKSDTPSIARNDSPTNNSVSIKVEKEALDRLYDLEGVDPLERLYDIDLRERKFIHDKRLDEERIKRLNKLQNSLSFRSLIISKNKKRRGLKVDINETGFYEESLTPISEELYDESDKIIDLMHV